MAGVPQAPANQKFSTDAGVPVVASVGRALAASMARRVLSVRPSMGMQQAKGQPERQLPGLSGNNDGLSGSHRGRQNRSRPQIGRLQ
jgi:hypothetical protein